MTSHYTLHSTAMIVYGCQTKFVVFTELLPIRAELYWQRNLCGYGFQVTVLHFKFLFVSWHEILCEIEHHHHNIGCSEGKWHRKLYTYLYISYRLFFLYLLVNTQLSFIVFKPSFHNAFCCQIIKLHPIAQLRCIKKNEAVHPKVKSSY